MEKHVGYSVVKNFIRNRGSLAVRETTENLNDDPNDPGDDYYVQYPYFEDFKPNPAVEMMHKMPRIGNVDNIVYAATSTNDETTQYYYGVISMSVFILLLFLVWSMVLLLLKLLGPSKFGCSSGHVYKMSNVEIQQQWYKTRLSRIRITFLICALCSLITSGIMIYFGLMPLNETYNQMMNTTEELQTKLSKTHSRVNNLLGDVESLADTCKTAYSGMVEIAESCPALNAVLEEGNKDNIVPNENVSVSSLSIGLSHRRLQNAPRNNSDTDVLKSTSSPSDEITATSTSTLEPTMQSSEAVSKDNEFVQITGTDSSTSTNSSTNESENSSNKNKSVQNPDADLSTSSPTDEASGNPSEENKSIEKTNTGNSTDRVSEKPNGDGTITPTSTLEPSMPQTDVLSTDNTDLESILNETMNDDGKREREKSTEEPMDKTTNSSTSSNVPTDTPTLSNDSKNGTDSNELSPATGSFSVTSTASPTIADKNVTKPEIKIKMPEISRPSKKPLNSTNEPSSDFFDNETYPPDFFDNETYPPDVDYPTEVPTLSYNNITLPSPNTTSPNVSLPTLLPKFPDDFTLPPDLSNFSIPPNFTLPPNFTIPPELDSIKKGIDEFVSLYKETSKSLKAYTSDTNAYLENFDTYLEAIRAVNTTTSTIYTTMESTSVWYISSLVFVGIVNFLTLVFMIRVLCSPKKRAEVAEEELDDEFNDDRGTTTTTSNKLSCWVCFQTYVLIPLYSIFMFLLLIFTCGFAIAVVANADICTGSPENNVMAIAEKFELNETAYQVLEYYIQGCTTNNVNFFYEKKGEDNPFGYLDGAQSTLKDVADVVKSFQSYDNFNKEFSAALCQTSDTWDRFVSLNTIASELGRLLESASDKIGLVMKSISCQAYTPIYIQYMHEDLCTKASNNIMVLFFCALALTIFVMIMLTLRVSLLQEPIDEAADLRRNEDDEEVLSLIGDGDNGGGHGSRDSSMPTQ